MNKIHFFTHHDVVRLGFVIPNPNQEELFLENVNREYIRRINKLLSKMLTPEEIETLANQNESSICNYFVIQKPECIERIQTIRNNIEDELKEKRKRALCEGIDTLFFQDTEEDMT